MATTTSDLKFFYSGALQTDVPQNNSLLSLGGKRSSSMIPNSRLNNLFDEVGYLELQEGNTNCRCIFLKNMHPTDSIINLQLWIEGKKDFEEIRFGISEPNEKDGSVYQLQNTIEVPFDVEFYEANAAEDSIIIKEELKAGYTIALWIVKDILKTDTRNIVNELKFHFIWD